MDPVVQIRLVLPSEAAGAVEEFLWSLEPGVVAVVENHGESELTVPLAEAVAAGLAAGLADFLAAAGIDAPFSLRTEPYPERDWQAAFRQEFTPLAIGDRLVVAPTWWEPPLWPGAICLRIDPQMAFGTGHHPTTRACLAWLVERGDNLGPAPGGLIDAGCGSGLLAIAAHHLGFAPVVAIDNDPIACATARANAAANHAAAIAVVDGDLATTPLGKVPTVVANLTASVILALLPTLLASLSPGGLLILAGILAERETEVATALAAAGQRVVRHTAADGWVALASEETRGPLGNEPRADHRV